MPRLIKIFKNFLVSLVLVTLVVCNFKLILQTATPINNVERVTHQTNFDFEPTRNSFSCGRFPEESDIIRDNEVWQEMRLSNESVKLLNAYLDKRMNRTVVRVNVNAVELNITRDTIYCQFWFDEKSEPYVVKATNYTLLWVKEWGICKNCKVPYLIACPTDFDGEGPTSVSITENSCDDASNNLKIINNQPFDGVKKKFGVCTKQLVLEDRGHGVKIIEWVHMLKFLGAHKVHMQIRNIHPDLVEVLNRLQAKELIEWKYYKDPTGIADTELYSGQHRLLQMNVINDCFYKVKNIYEYIATLDPDEVIMPVMEEDRTWQDIFNRLDESYFKFIGISSANVYYPHKNLKPYNDIPEHNYMLQHVQRSVSSKKKKTGIKSFINPARVIVCHNHFAIHCLKQKDASLTSCDYKLIEENISQLSHYRDKVLLQFNDTVLDTKIWKFKDELIEAVRETLEEISFKP